MRATGKLRAIFGPANRSSLGHEMTEKTASCLPSEKPKPSSGKRSAAQYTSTYVVPRNPANQSHR